MADDFPKTLSKRVYLFVEGPMSRHQNESIFLSRVEGPMSRIEDRGQYLLLNDDFFSEDIFFLCRSVQFGRHVPPRFDLMSVNMIALHIINVFATAQYSYSQPTTRKMNDVVCSIQDQRFKFEDRGSGISHLLSSQIKNNEILMIT